MHNASSRLGGGVEGIKSKGSSVVVAVAAVASDPRGRVLILSDTSFTGHKTYTGRWSSGGWIGISEGVHSDDD